MKKLDDDVIFIWDGKDLPRDHGPLDEEAMKLDEANLPLIFKTEEEYYTYLKSRETEQKK